MAHISPDTIIARLDAGHWTASFEPRPQVGFGGNLPVVAIRRPLEGTDAHPATYELRCESDQAQSDPSFQSLTWDPPEILFPCETCKGTGQYVGLLETGPCKACGGRKVVRA